MNSKSFNQKVGEQLKKARLENKLSCQEMADYIHCAKSTYFYYERGDVSMPIESLIKASKRLKFDWVEVVNNASK